MYFLVWHYVFGIPLYFHRWIIFFKRIIHFFALPVLIKSLFAPWKRMLVGDSEPGFNLQRYFENLTFNIISRSIGIVVRFFLILFCLFSLLLCLIFGFVFLTFWLFFPPLSLPYFIKNQKSLDKFMSNLTSDIKNKPDQAIKILFNNPAGKYLLAHLGQDIHQILDNTPVSPKFLEGLQTKTYQELINWFLISHSGIEPKLRNLNLNNQDLILAARCWDYQKTHNSKNFFSNDPFDYPGIGAELLTGYTPNLNKYAESLNTKPSFANHLVGRQEIVTRLSRVLQTGKSALLVGQPGVGKKTVIYEFVHRASRGETGNNLAYSRVLELNYQSILSESFDLNQKKVRFSNLITEAAAAGNVILVLKDFQRLTTTEFEGFDFTDVICQALEKGNLKIIAIASTVDYERFLARDSRITKFFETIEVVPPSKDEALELLIAFSQQIELDKKIIITSPALRQVLNGSDRYITDTPFPEKTLELLEETILSKSSNTPVTVDDVNLVISEKTGISLSRLTDQEQSKLSNLETIIHKDLINQKTAVSLIAKSLRGRTLGVKNEDRPIGTFLFLGPTGVGKTQTAKVLADVYFGDRNNIIRFDMAEYVGPEGVSRLIGSVEKNLPGALTTAIKNHPASLLLLDEMEKCTPEILNFFLTLLDEGYINDASGKKVICRHLFVIATSNAGSEFIRESVVAGVRGEQLQQTVIDYVQKKGYFSPEFLNRFDGVVVYEPLSPENLIEVATLLLKDLQKTLLTKNITLNFDEKLSQKIAIEGYDPAFGARPMRRIIDLTLSDLISRALLSKEIASGDTVEIKPLPSKDEYQLSKS